MPHRGKLIGPDIIFKATSSGIDTYRLKSFKNNVNSMDRLYLLNKFRPYHQRKVLRIMINEALLDIHGVVIDGYQTTTNSGPSRMRSANLYRAFRFST